MKKFLLALSQLYICAKSETNVEDKLVKDENRTIANKSAQIKWRGTEKGGVTRASMKARCKNEKDMHD